MIGAFELAKVLGLAAPTDEQAAVIEAPLVPTLVVAGAGSGKTETMAARVLYLVANGVVRPENVLGLTFTRKAASGLAARIRRRLRTLAAAGVLRLPLEPTGAKGSTAIQLDGEPEVWTYHAFGGRLISEFGPLVGVEPRARVLTPTASWQLARRVVARWDGDLMTDLRPEQVTEHLLAISGGLADHLQTANALAEVNEEVLRSIRQAPPGRGQRAELRADLVDHLRRLTDRNSIIPLVEAFAAAKRAAGVIDFADQMQIAAELASRADRVGSALRDRHRVVLLDEYQDTGHAQRIILRALFGRPAVSIEPPGRQGALGHPVTAVGDPVQSIYSWRGASASNLPRFATDFPLSDGGPARTLTLSTSFRNAESVLAVANEVSAPVRAGRVVVLPLRPLPGAPTGDVRAGLFGTVEEEDAWVARSISERWEQALTQGAPAPTTAVLLRRRRDMDAMATALRAAGLPVEVVGLGGLLAEPEVADLVAMLRVLVDPAAGDAAIRLLTGARWRLGLADLDALFRRATGLAGQRLRRIARAEGPDRGRDEVRSALAEAIGAEDVDTVTLADAIADPGPAERYSTEGYRRLVRFAAELTRLRARLGQPLADLVADIERTTGLDIEVAVHSPAGRVHLDAFADVVSEVAATGAGAAELIDYLQTAEDREDGLAPGEVEPHPGRVQILTVHAAKGLEWDIVAVPHLSASVFPTSQGRSWLSDSTQLPPVIRGDRDDLPQLHLPVGGDQKEVSAAIARHVDELKAETRIEERRLLYVALTRAERTLLVSAHHWGRTSGTPHGPGEFLTEITELAPRPAGLAVEQWAATPAPGERNPLTATPRRGTWPTDPLGNRRAAARRGADLVLAQLGSSTAAAGSGSSGLESEGTDPDPSAGTGPDPSEGADPDRYHWSRDAEALLSERSRSAAQVVEVDLPPGLSVSTLVELADDPDRLARRLRRPVPSPPTAAARRGTAFHAWLERRFHGDALWDVSELPGASDSGASAEPALDLLKQAFLRSEWADRVPVEMEMPFATTIAGIGVRGRMDAVFADPDGGCTVVDWKTGAVPGPGHVRSAAVQLAVYRLAAAELLSLPLSRVRAAFVYIAAGRTVSPVDLLDAAGLEELLRPARVGEPEPDGTRLTPTAPIHRKVGARSPDADRSGPLLSSTHEHMAPSSA